MLLAVVMVLPGVTLAQAPEHVTSDTKDYCFALAQRLDETGAMPAQVRQLWLDGRMMCEHGKVQGGLLRLRHAMMIMHNGPVQ